MRARTRCAAILGIALVAPIVPARDAEADCPAGFGAVTEIELFFGRDIEKRGMVTERQFHDFVGKTVTPALPDGFTLTAGRASTATRTAGSSWSRPRSCR